MSIAKSNKLDRLYIFACDLSLRRSDRRTSMPRDRQLHLNAFLMSSGHHEAAWRLPDSDPRADVDPGHWRDLARLAERGRFDSVFLADRPALSHGGSHRPGGTLEPTIVLAIMAAATERIGVIATASTTYNDPFNLARRFASVDHVSGGRAGWNIVTTADEDAALNFSLSERPDHARRYERAEEFLEVALKLWDSWEDDAILADKDAGRFADPARIHTVDHAGEHFSVRGPLNLSRSPQGRPLIVQAGSSPDGRAFAARHAEAIFTAQQTLEDGQAFYADMKRRAADIGRDPDGVKILPGIAPVIGSTEAEAQAIQAELDEAIVPEYGMQRMALTLEIPLDALSLDEQLPFELLPTAPVEGAQSRAELIVDLARRESLTVRQLLSRLGGGRGHRTMVGTPEQIADSIEHWFDSGAADGFNVMPALLPSGLEIFVDHVIPLLVARGLFRSEYTGSTLREHYGIPRPASRYAEPIPA
jgi:FMN-dependent oxidoreductase (nitrilotriacetate monooxygenase family)